MTTLDFTEEEMNEALGRIISAFGLALRAGKCSVGTEKCVEDMRAEKIKLLAVASDNSENTKKKLNDTSKYHNINILFLPCDKLTLAQKLGKKGEASCAGILDDGFVKIIEKLYGQVHTRHTEVQQ